MSTRPRLLDLFSGAGGAAMGYYRAGFDVVGVDVVPQPRYPFDHIVGDALAVLGDIGRSFDAVHASPPCQRYSAATRDPSRHPDLYAATVRALIDTTRRGQPFVLENVPGAPFGYGFTLCGTMFGLAADGEWLRRHRTFEPSWLQLAPPACVHPSDRRPITITGHARVAKVTQYGHSRQGPAELAARLMGIDWMTHAELVEAIPPAYSEYVGTIMLRQLV